MLCLYQPTSVIRLFITGNQSVKRCNRSPGCEKGGGRFLSIYPDVASRPAVGIYRGHLLDWQAGKTWEIVVVSFQPTTQRGNIALRFGM